MYKTRCQEVAGLVRTRAYAFNCSYKTAWNEWVNDEEKKNFIYKQIKPYLHEAYVMKENADLINSPDHYQGKTEVIDIIEQATEGLTGIQAVCVGNMIKYIMRHSKKNGVEDLKKSRWYLDKLIESMEGDR